MQQVTFPASYIEKIAMCLRAHAINLGNPDSVTAARNYLDQVAGELLTALENIESAQHGAFMPPRGVEIDWCEANMAFALTCNGVVVDHFPTRADAVAYAKNEKLATGMGNSGEAASLCG